VGPGALRRDGPLRARRSTARCPSRLGHADLQLLAQRGRNFLLANALGAGVPPTASGGAVARAVPRLLTQGGSGSRTGTAAGRPRAVASCRS
jgi:hypothetical protein